MTAASVFLGKRPKCQGCLPSLKQGAESGPCLGFVLRWASPRLVNPSSTCRALKPTNSIKATLLKSHAGNSFIDCPPKSTDDADTATQTAPSARAPVALRAIASVPPPPSAQSLPGTQKIRPTALLHSTRASPQSLLRRTTPAPPAHHLAMPVASSAVPSPHWAALALRFSLALPPCSSESPFSRTLPSSSFSGNPF